MKPGHPDPVCFWLSVYAWAHPLTRAMLSMAEPFSLESERKTGEAQQ